MNKILNNYFYKVGLLFVTTLCINFTKKIVYCALLFTCLTLILNFITKYHGSKKAAISLLLCTTTTLGLLYNKSYCIITGQPISGLIASSLCALLIAGYIGFKLFFKLEARYGFALSNCISGCIAALVDHLIMGLFFIRILPIHKVWLIVYKETAYTYLFSVLVYLCLVAMLYAKPVYMKIKQCVRLLISARQVKSNLYK